MKLLSKGSSNTKTAKSEAQGTRFTTVIQYMMPHKAVCPWMSDGCGRACLQSAGMGVFTNVKQARIARRNLYLSDRIGYFGQLIGEISRAERSAMKNGKSLAVRLNGTSDIAFEETGILSAFPYVQFYDYTKGIERVYRKLPNNYHLTISRTESNEAECFKALSLGLANVAIVFRNELPDSYKGFKVVDGTTHDMRFLDEHGVIVGLRALGKAKRDVSGFVVDVKERVLA